MTKKEQYQKLRSLFFQVVEEHYPNTQIDSDGGGRWQISMENGLEFELGSINYGGEVLSSTMRGEDNYKKSTEIERDLNTIWESVWNNFYEEFNS